MLLKRVSEVHVFFQSKLWGVGSLQNCQTGKENQCFRQCGMSLSLHFIGMFTTVEFRMKLLELVVYRAATGHKQNVLRQLLLYWIRLKYTVRSKSPNFRISYI